jgi:hypothetical protein
VVRLTGTLIQVPDNRSGTVAFTGCHSTAPLTVSRAVVGRCGGSNSPGGLVAKRNKRGRRADAKGAAPLEQAHDSNRAPASGASPSLAEAPPDIPKGARGLLGEKSVRGFTIIGVIAALIAIYPIFADDDASLEVIAFEVRDPGEVDATVYDVSDPEGSQQQQTINTNQFDITLQNDGGMSAFIEEIEVTLKYAQQMEDCRQSGGEMRVSAEYTVPVPVDGRAVPFDLSRDISFEVEAGRVDRMSISLGPEEQSISSAVPWVYAAEISLRYNGGDETVKVGSGAVLARPGEAAGQLEAALEGNFKDCVAVNADMFDEAIAEADEASAELREMQASFRAALAPSSTVPATPAVASCLTGGAAAMDIVSACFTYRADTLEAVVETTPSLPPMVSHVVMSIEQKPDGAPLRWASRWFGDQWGAGFVTDDLQEDQYGGNGCGPCAVEGDARGFTSSTPTYGLFTATTLSVRVSLVDFSIPESPVVLVSYGPVEVQQGR